MISYNFLTPIDEDHTQYFWLQHRNTDPQDQSITQSNAIGIGGHATSSKHQENT
jgi:vanillate O-demethylase monooxygenase subunit